ncbi:MAG: hypothetical protein DRH24_14320 [Deltaproteobacteria bacterium]|nr:MAG: hypothetical protein DRH24_14320 [Deltaproteobacteria bacterium]
MVVMCIHEGQVQLTSMKVKGLPVIISIEKSTYMSVKHQLTRSSKRPDSTNAGQKGLINEY